MGPSGGWSNTPTSVNGPPHASGTLGRLARGFDSLVDHLRESGMDIGGGEALRAPSDLPDYMHGLWGIKTPNDDKHSDAHDLEFPCFDISHKAVVAAGHTKPFMMSDTSVKLKCEDAFEGGARGTRVARAGVPVEWP